METCGDHMLGLGLESHEIYNFNFLKVMEFIILVSGKSEFKWGSWKVMEKKYAFWEEKRQKDNRLKKLWMSQKQTLISGEVHTCTFSMRCNPGPETVLNSVNDRVDTKPIVETTVELRSWGKLGKSWNFKSSKEHKPWCGSSYPMKFVEQAMINSWR